MLLCVGVRLMARFTEWELIGSLSSVETGHFKLMWMINYKLTSLGLLYPHLKGMIYSKVVGTMASLYISGLSRPQQNSGL